MCLALYYSVIIRRCGDERSLLDSFSSPFDNAFSGHSTGAFAVFFLIQMHNVCMNVFVPYSGPAVKAHPSFPANR
jgi:hypothetical protein